MGAVSEPVFFMDRTVVAAAGGPGGTVVLDGPEGHHAATVRRLGPGEGLVLTDGRGLWASATVREAQRDRLLLVLDDLRDEPAAQPRLVVVQALAKGERGETAVETMTEVGVDVVVPWAAARCVTVWREARGAKALERWRATAREAAKQARRVHWPEVEPLAATDDLVPLCSAADLAVVLHETATEPLATTAVPPRGTVVLVVGPEGGVTDDELATLATAGAVVRRLGPTVLRTSTAGTVAAAAVLSRTARWA
jgi:16S rRNA (uracil1498-N3)-methyltransferase